MFAQLPEPIQNQVMTYLKADNFFAAKQLHDAWLADDFNGLLGAANENIVSQQESVAT